ncbi:hypothetical protein F511_07854 [Dorcoceras hygrometricum]|uniref:Uncharacterized protein n=1 Tax=Dorcoceras hygrometricum TaxID=472368 RepID=A0A2Z7AZX6_9LAMI|nr:hypothetical protein F511_07854 [Dorcoceras hygrometricum]
MQAALSKVTIENDELRSRSQEMLNENQRLADIISSWTKSSTSLQKMQATMKPSGDKSRIGHGSDESSMSEPSTHPQLDRTKLQTMDFVKSSTGQPEEAQSDESNIADKPPIWQGRYCRLGVGLKVNWAHVLLAAMVSTPGKKSQGYAVQLSLLLEKLVKADLGESVALHPLKVLNNKLILTYMKKNQAAPQAGEASKLSWDTKDEKNSLLMTSSDADKVPLETLARTDGAAAKQKLILAPSDSESTVYLSLPEIKKKLRTKRQKKVNLADAKQAEPTLVLVPTIPDEAEEVSTSGTKNKDLASRVSAEEFAFAPMEIQEINWDTHFLPKIDPTDKGNGVLPQFQTGYRLNKITSMKLVEEFAKVEDLLLLWAETEKHMRKFVAEHWKDFNKDKPSANQDLMSIRLLEAALVKARRSVSLFQAKVGLSITFPKSSTDRAASMDITPGRSIRLSLRSSPSQHPLSNRLSRLSIQSHPVQEIQVFPFILLIQLAIMRIVRVPILPL